MGLHGLLLDAVLEGTNCEVVGIQWLIDSIRDKQPVNTDVYLLNPAADNGQGDSQPKENSPDSPGSNKRKLEEDKDIDEEPSKVQRNKLAVHRKELIALVDDRFDTQGKHSASTQGIPITEHSWLTWFLIRS